MSALYVEVSNVVEALFRRHPALCGFAVREDLSFSNVSCHPALHGMEATELLDEISERLTSCWKSGPKPPTCCAAARSRGCSTSPARGLLLSAHFAAEPQPKGATMEPMQTEDIPSNVQEMPGQQDETFQNARERLNETFATVKQRAGEACEYTDQVGRPIPGARSASVSASASW